MLEYAFYNTVKSIDNKHIASSGDIMSYLQEPVNINGYSDYSGLHIYTYDNDIIKHRYLYGSLLNIYINNNDIKIMLEEFGFSSDQFYEESISRFTWHVQMEPLGPLNSAFLILKIRITHHTIGALWSCILD